MTMTNTNESPSAYFTHLISYSSVVLGCMRETIGQIFPEKEYCLITYYNGKNEETERVLEIGLNGATLACWLDEDNKCYLSFLFVESLDDMELYIDVCNRLYRYDYVGHKWSLPKCYMGIKTMLDDIIFVFTPVGENE